MSCRGNLRVTAHESGLWKGRDLGLEEGLTHYCWEEYFEEQDNSAYGPDELLFFEIHPEADKDRRESQDFWESVLGDATHAVPNYTALVKGFAEGALDYWWSVEDEL